MPVAPEVELQWCTFMRAGHRAELTADCMMVTLVVQRSRERRALMKRGSGYIAAVRSFPDEVSGGTHARVTGVE